MIDSKELPTYEWHNGEYRKMHQVICPDCKETRLVQQKPKKSRRCVYCAKRNYKRDRKANNMW